MEIFFSNFRTRTRTQKKQESIDAQSRRSGESVDELKRHLANTEDQRVGSGGWIVTLKGYSYNKERATLNKLAKDIYEKNKSDFLSSEDVFKIFATACMTGRLLPVARLIEKTYGKGSFREIGEKTR